MKLLFFFLYSFSIMSCSKPNDQVTPPQEANDSLGTGWKKIPIGANSESIVDIFFINNTTGYFISGRSIFRSTDSGNSWQKVHQSANYLNNIAIGNANNAVFASQSKDILMTHDGGTSFDSVTVQDGIVDVFFVNAGVAYAMGSKTWKTTNAGNSWTNISSFSTDTIFGDKSLYFINEQTGWVTGGGFFKTINGGITWVRQPTEGFSFGSSGNIYFTDANTGYITDVMSVIKTSNGGVSFTKIFQRSGRGVGYHDIHFINSQTGYTTDNGSILKTIDGGQTWTKDVVLKTGQLFELHFTDASHGWAAGPPGFILKYEQ